MSQVLAQAPTFESRALMRTLSACRPFEGLPTAMRHEELRRSGMHGAFREGRVGCDAFDIRPDLTVGDACETVEQLLRQIQGALELLSVCANTSRIVTDSCAGCASLARQAGGAMAVVKAALFTQEPATGETAHP